MSKQEPETPEEIAKAILEECSAIEVPRIVALARAYLALQKEHESLLHSMTDALVNMVE